MRLVVVGMGYAGIPSAALFADVPGFSVVGVQRRSRRSGWKIECLNRGGCPIGGEEPGLAELIERVTEKGSLRVTDDVSVYGDADAVLIDVQTPVDEDLVPRYDSLREVSGEVGRWMRPGVMVGIESTVAPGTTRHVVKPILEEASGMRAGSDFNLFYSYERVTAGRLLHNLVNMPRVVGGYTPRCANRGAELYRRVVRAEVVETDCITAEIAKVAENAYRDVNIAFANEIALMCESLGADVHRVRGLVNGLPYDPSEPSRNPFRFMMEPGAGVGGHCLPKDPWLLKYGVDTYGRTRVHPWVIISSRAVNEYMPSHMLDLIRDALDEAGVRMGDARVAVLGYAFIENSDDARGTPAHPLCLELESVCGDVVVHDPYVKEAGRVRLTGDLASAVEGRDCVAVVTRHREYLSLELGWLKGVMRTPVIVDGRNVFSPAESRRAGFVFRGVGVGA